MISHATTIIAAQVITAALPRTKRDILGAASPAGRSKSDEASRVISAPKMRGPAIFAARDDIQYNISFSMTASRARHQREPRKAGDEAFRAPRRTFAAMHIVLLTFRAKRGGADAGRRATNMPSSFKAGMMTMPARFRHWPCKRREDF